MRKYFFLGLLTSGFFIWQASPILADGVEFYRNIQSNSILKCSSPRQIELSYTGAGIASSASRHTLLCLKNNRQADWIMYSSIFCQRYCQLWFSSEDIGASRKAIDHPFVLKPQKTAIGINCKIQTRPPKLNEYFDYYWNCEKYQARRNLTIVTKSQMPFKYRDNDRNKFQLNTYDNPSCKKDQSDSYPCFQHYPELGNDGNKYNPEMAIDCRGDKEFCNLRYNP